LAGKGKHGRLCECVYELYADGSKPVQSNLNIQDSVEN
jgi:hypothetical protein